MDTVAHDFLVKILETPSASGYEQPVQKLVREYLKPCAETIETDAHGNVIGTANPGGSCRHQGKCPADRGKSNEQSRQRLYDRRQVRFRH